MQSVYLSLSFVSGLYVLIKIGNILGIPQGQKLHSMITGEFAVDFIPCDLIHFTVLF